MKTLYFTSIKTVKCNNFELLQNDFFYKMSRLITNDCKNYHVSYNEDEKHFEVVYNSQKYVVECYKNISEKDYNNIKFYLDRLVALSDFQTKLTETTSSIKKEEEAKKEALLESAKYGVAKTADELEAKIEMLKEESKEEGTAVIGDALEKLYDINEGDPDDLGPLRAVLGIGGAIGLVVMVSLALIGSATIPVLAYIGSGFCTLDLITYIVSDMYSLDYRGLYASVFSGLAAPFIFAGYGIRRLVELINLSFKLRPIKKAIRKLRSGEKLKELKKDNIGDILRKTKKDKKKETTSVMMSFKEFADIKNSILTIKDEKTKKELANELYQILDYCVKTANTSFKDKTYDILFEQLSNIKTKIEVELKKEEEYQENTTGLYKLMSEIKESKEEVKSSEEVIKQKSIGAR